jgi:hypothetical protein
MAVLPDPARADIWAEWMRRNAETCGISKAELRAAVNAIDAWVNANANALNTAISQPARGALTTAQKARLLSMVVERRYLDGA